MDHRYTTGEVRLIKELWGEVPAKQLADELGVSEHALEQYACRLGLRRTGGLVGVPWQEHEDKALIAMASRGCTDEEISNALGRGTRSVRRRRNKLGV